MVACKPELGESMDEEHQRRVRLTLGHEMQADASGQRGMGVVRAISP
jgi:hypothetical protein